MDIRTVNDEESLRVHLARIDQQCDGFWAKIKPKGWRSGAWSQIMKRMDDLSDLVRAVDHEAVCMYVGHYEHAAHYVIDHKDRDKAKILWEKVHTDLVYLYRELLKGEFENLTNHQHAMLTVAIKGVDHYDEKLRSEFPGMP